MRFSVKLHNVTKRYKMHSKKSDKLKSLFSTGDSENDFYAVRDISFEAKPGDIVGIIGINGSGKSTISNLIANVTAPTYGSIKVKGEVALIAVSAGLNKELTGRENIELKCLMMGIDKEEIKRLEPEIIEFADIGKFIDMPVKKYSSGMKSRLGFAISVSVDPDVLIIDEALSVGDQTFADKCLDKLNEFKARGKTIFFISHSAAQVRSFCTKAIWLEHGEVRDQGTIEEVLPQYTEFIKEYKKMNKKEQQAFKQKGIEKQAESRFQTGPLSSKKRKKKTKKRMKHTITTIAMLAIVSFTYVAKDEISASVNDVFSSKSSQEEKSVAPITNTVEEREQEVDSIDDSPERSSNYGVGLETATLKSSPSVSAEDAGELAFGDPFIIKSETTDVEGTSWYETFNDKGENVWVDKESTTDIQSKDVIEGRYLIDFLEKETSLSLSLKETQSALGKNKVVLDREYGEPLLVDDEFRYDNELVLHFNDKSVADRAILNGIQIPSDQMIEEVGEPSLSNDSSTKLLYHTEAYDYVLTVEDDGNIRRVTIISPSDATGAE